MLWNIPQKKNLIHANIFLFFPPFLLWYMNNQTVVLENTGIAQILFPT